MANDHRGAVEQQDLVADLDTFGQSQVQAGVGAAGDAHAIVVDHVHAVDRGQFRKIGRQRVTDIDGDWQHRVDQADHAEFALLSPDVVCAAAQNDICRESPGRGVGRDSGQRIDGVGGVGAQGFAGVDQAVGVDVVEQHHRGAGFGHAFDGDVAPRICRAGDAIAFDGATVISAVEPQE